MAHINIHLSKIKYNALLLKHMLEERGIQMVPVLKCAAGDSEIAQLFENLPFQHVAESRLKIISEATSSLNYMMIKGATPNEIAKLVSYTSMSIQTDLDIIRRINTEAHKQNKHHHILLMVDWKDGREGLLTYETVDYLNEMMHMDHIFLKGLAFNFMCYRQMPPTEEDISYIERFLNSIEQETGFNFTTISGGNSSMLTLAMYHDLGKINELRIGEAIFRGYETAHNQRLPFLYDDAIELVGQIVEIKPRLNLSTHQPYMQALVDIGNLDTVVSELTPVDTKVKIVGSTSDLMLIDLGDTHGYQIGDTMTFKVEYGALAHSMHSTQLSKQYLYDKGIELMLENLKCTKENKILNRY
ncbi:alanine racemase [Staphylococcus hyicus]|uniref:alanine racemase n=1 Tax=Staphylococcus hyicus TaxID=1284 RepID=UPI00211C73C9|nr:alanine racemase [Staphylococcus hyicus]MCQ9306734.1 alanine racemase [Staphylococcus hyicus]MCQ9309147.1 alanine racemase [Staphylococcus hyicus]MCQ9311568.1 alanine racemase [Staphylococcus hyicus]